MSRTKEREKAIALRKVGMSYSQIKSELDISKSTLSGWLNGMPLSNERIRELRDNSQVRIEKTRETKRRNKESRRLQVYRTVSGDIEKSKDPKFVAGFYLYWGEGTKTAEYTVAFTNSDASMVRCFIEWLAILDVSENDLKVKLHLYSDQNENEQKKFWAAVTGVPLGNFNKSYVKTTRSDRKTYKGMFSQGTCVVMYHNRDVYEYVLAGVQYLRDKYGLPTDNR